MRGLRAKHGIAAGKINPATLSDAALIKYARSKGIPASSRWKRETTLEKLGEL